MLVCVFSSHFAHETAGAARIRHSLLPLLRDGVMHNPDALRRGDVYACLELAAWEAVAASAWPASPKQPKANAVLHKISVAKPSSAKAKITAAKQPGTKP